MQVTCPGHLLFLDFIARKIFSWRLHLIRVFIVPYSEFSHSSSSSDKISSISTLFLNTLNIFCLANVRDQVLQRVKDRQNYISVHLIFMFFYNKLERKCSWKNCGNELWIRRPTGVYSGRIITSDPISVILLGVEEYKWLQVSPIYPPPRAVTSLLFNTNAQLSES